MVKRTIALTEDESKEDCRNWLIEEGLIKKNEPLDDESYERILKKAISLGVVVERYEFDPETGHRERMLEFILDEKDRVTCYLN